LIGCGESINILLDSWCGPPIAFILNLDQSMHSHLSAKVCDFISNHQ